MAKIKVKSFKPQFTVSAHLTWKERVVEQQSAILRNNYVKGLMRLSDISGKTLIFSAPADMQLGQMLYSGIDRVCFFQMIVQLVNVLRWLNSQKLPVAHLELNMDYVYVNSATKELFFIYYPIETDTVPGNLRSFLERLVYDSSFAVGENTDFKCELLSMIRGNVTIHTQMLEQYVETYCPEAASGITGTNQKSNYPRADSRLAYGGQRYQHEESADGTAGTDIFYHLPETYGEDTGGATIGTTALHDNSGTTVLDEQGTIVLNRDDGGAVVPRLIRKRTDEAIRIDKPVFRIGKEEGYVDYLIPDNPAISRSHADIITKDGKYFIYDNSSTNRTYVNNVMIPSLKDIVLEDGATIRMADEEFEFRVLDY